MFVHRFALGGGIGQLQRYPFARPFAYRRRLAHRSDGYLPASHFVRIHRSYVVSLFDIDTFVGNMLRIGDKWFPIGRLYRPGVLALLNILNYVCRSPEDGG